MLISQVCHQRQCGEGWFSLSSPYFHFCQVGQWHFRMRYNQPLRPRRQNCPPSSARWVQLGLIFNWLFCKMSKVNCNHGARHVSFVKRVKISPSYSRPLNNTILFNAVLGKKTLDFQPFRKAKLNGKSFYNT